MIAQLHTLYVARGGRKKWLISLSYLKLTLS
jgi:hypothetical protein